MHIAHVSCVCELCRARSGARAAQQRLATGPRGPLYRAGGWRGGTPRPRPPPTALPRRGAMGDGARRGGTAAIAGYRRERSTGAGDGLRAVFANVQGLKLKPRCLGYSPSRTGVRGCGVVRRDAIMHRTRISPRNAAGAGWRSPCLKGKCVDRAYVGGLDAHRAQQWGSDHSAA